MKRTPLLTDEQANKLLTHIEEATKEDIINLCYYVGYLQGCKSTLEEMLNKKIV